MTGLTWNDLPALHEPTVTTVPVCLRGDIAVQINHLEQQLRAVKDADEKSNAPNEAPVLAARILELQAEAQKYEVEFTFQAIGKGPWRELKAQHPPTKAQLDKYPFLDANPDTFPYAAVAACSVVPADATAANVKALAEKISDGQWDRLWEACVGVNAVAVDVPKCETATGVLGRSAATSTPAP